MTEQFSIVNGEDEHLYIVHGKENLHQSNASGYHRAVHIIVEAFFARLVLQKKAKGTENAGKWSSGVSGHVRFNESYKEAAIREAKEELGLEIDPDELHKIVKMPPSDNNGGEFVMIYTYLINPEEEVLKVNSTEIDEIVIGKMFDLIVDIENHKDDYSPAFVEIFNVCLA